MFKNVQKLQVDKSSNQEHDHQKVDDKPGFKQYRTDDKKVPSHDNQPHGQPQKQQDKPQSVPQQKVSSTPKLPQKPGRPENLLYMLLICSSK